MFDWYWAILYGFLVHVFVVTWGSIFLHRVYAHRQLNCTPMVDNIGRVLLWSVGIYWPAFARTWAAVHRKHHNNSDSIEDPHSPKIYSFSELLFPKTFSTPGKAYYMTPELRDELASDVPLMNDKLDGFLMRYSAYGRLPWLLLALILFSWPGLLIEIVWMAFTRFSGRLHNVLSHNYGYRNEQPKMAGDQSVNIFPIGALWGGEEFGANHHDYPWDAKFSRRWFEFDPAWPLIKLLEHFGQVEIIRPR